MSSSFDQSDASIRVEWGPEGLHAIAPADVTIVVDVLSFSTCVDVATARGAAVLPYEWKDGTAVEYAARNSADLAGPRSAPGFSLSPASFATAKRGSRVVLPSPNGATISRLASQLTGTVIAGCLRNAGAVARAAARLGGRVNVIAAGERWPDGGLRPALEDWLGAGAILRALPGSPSAEARAAIAAFEMHAPELEAALLATGSGRELAVRGFQYDVTLAAQADASRTVPILIDGAFVAELSDSQ